MLEKTGTKGSFVNVGLTKPLEIDQRLTPGIRCTVQILPGQKGKVVSPSAPREENGMYWGYACRMAASLQAVFDECPFEEGYDLKIGTSERGSVSLDDKGYTVPKYRHALIVFGGVAGLEECVNADESIKLGANQTHTLFDQYVNICPYQGSRTIRTEEAVLICLAKMSPVLSSSESTDEKREPQVQTKVEFDDSPSEESSDDE